MLIRRKGWPCRLVPIVFIFLSIALPVLANYNTYEGSLPYRQEAIDAIETECGADVTVKAGEKYLFDSKSAAEYEASLYAAEYGENYNSGPTRRKRSPSAEEIERIERDVKDVKVKIIRPAKKLMNTKPQRLQRPQQTANAANKPMVKPEEDVVVVVENTDADTNSEATSADEVEETETDTEIEVVTTGRAYGGGGGGKSRYGHGYGNHGGYSSHRGGYSHGGGNYHRGGHYGYGYPSKPAVCEWTFHAADDCSLESHIIKFKPGDMDCYKQQLIISDNYTDFRMCGYQKLYPGFRAETPVLIIKYWKQPYTYRHVFKGYVTCVGRAQRPNLGYDDSESYNYKPEAPPATTTTTTSTSTHAHSTLLHSNANTATHHEQPSTHGHSEHTAQDVGKVLISPGTHSIPSHQTSANVQGSAQVSVQEHHPQQGEQIIVKVVEDRRPVQQTNSEQVFTMAQVQEMIQHFMQAQKASELAPAPQPQSQSHAINAHAPQEQIIVKVEDIVHQDPQLHQGQVHMSVGEKMANLHHQQVQEQVLTGVQPQQPTLSDMERQEAKHLMDEANAAMIQASHAQKFEDEMMMVNEAKEKLAQAQVLLHEADKQDQLAQAHNIAESQLERPQEVHPIVHEPQKQIQPGSQGEIQESVIVVEESHQPQPQQQPSRIESLLQEIANKASPAHEGNPSPVSQSSTHSSSSSTSTNSIIFESSEFPSIDESLHSLNTIVVEVAAHGEKPNEVSQPSSPQSSHSTHPITDTSQVEFLPLSNLVILESPSSEVNPTLPQSVVHAPSLTHHTSESSHIELVPLDESVHSPHTNIFKGPADPQETPSQVLELHSIPSAHPISTSQSFHSTTETESLSYAEPNIIDDSYPILPHTATTSVVNPYHPAYPSQYQQFTTAYPPTPVTISPSAPVVDPYAKVVDSYTHPVAYPPVTEYYPQPVFPISDHPPPISPLNEPAPYVITPDYSKPISGSDQSPYYQSPSSEHVPYPLAVDPSHYPSVSNYSPVSNYPSQSFHATSNQMYGARNQLSETDYEQIATGRSREESDSKKKSKTSSRLRPQPAPAVPSYNPAPYPVQVMQPQPPTYPPPTEGYQVLVTSPTDPNVQYVVTCQHPYPYPCIPVHSNPPPPAPSPPQQVPIYAAPGMYGR